MQIFEGFCDEVVNALPWVKKLSYLLSPEESNLYLAVGVVALFLGVRLIYLPAALILIGLIFCGLAFLEEKQALLKTKGHLNGSS